MESPDAVFPFYELGISAPWKTNLPESVIHIIEITLKTREQRFVNTLRQSDLPTFSQHVSSIISISVHLADNLHRIANSSRSTSYLPHKIMLTIIILAFLGM